MWQSRWDKRKNALPVAGRIELTIREVGRGSRVATLLVPIPRGSGA